MNTYGKCVLTGVSLVVAYGLMLPALRMLNRPSDLSLYSGLAVLFVLLAALPALLREIWRRRI